VITVEPGVGGAGNHAGSYVGEPQTQPPAVAIGPVCWPDPRT